MHRCVDRLLEETLSTMLVTMLCAREVWINILESRTAAPTGQVSSGASRAEEECVTGSEGALRIVKARV